jgi:hypothetical protein
MRFHFKYIDRIVKDGNRCNKYICTVQCNLISDVMVSMLALSAVDHGFELWSGQTKDYKIGICCLSAKHAALRRKSKD